jgi:exodeoxyribonuclease V alpha subunit
VISNEPERLAEVDGIGEKKIVSIVESWKEHKEKSHILIKLQDLGLTLRTAMKIYNEYGNNSIKIIKENPYQLADDIFGII